MQLAGVRKRRRLAGVKGNRRAFGLKGGADRCRSRRVGQQTAQSLKVMLDAISAIVQQTDVDADGF